MTASARRPRFSRAVLTVAVAVGLLSLQLAGAAPASGQAANFGALSVADPAQRTEPNLGASTTVRFIITLDRTGGAGNVNVDYRTVDGTAVAGSDYIARDGSLLFSGIQRTKRVDVTILGDNIDEDDETFTLELLNPVNGTIADATATATIGDNDALPRLSISDARVGEGDTGDHQAVFVVTLSPASARTVTVDYATAAGTADPGSDFTSSTGTLSFSPGATSRFVAVAVTGDTVDEADEEFTVVLSGAANAALAAGGGEGTGTIVDDDGPPTLSIADASVDEGGTATFAVTLSNPSGKTVTVLASTTNGTATAPADYAAETNTTVTFAPGVTTQDVTVGTAADETNEPDELFFVTLTASTNAAISRGVATGTIVDDDDGPTFSISDVEQAEGGAGVPGLPTSFDFTITKTGATNQTLTVNYSTADGTATAGSDYTAVPEGSSITFLPSETQKTVTVTVVADAFAEASETFTVNLAAPSADVVIGDGQGTGTILNDDGAPATVEILDRTVTEGTGGSMSALFTVKVSAGRLQPVTFNYATADGTATAGADYSATSGSAGFLGGSNETTISVSINPDALDEDDEAFAVVLSNVQNAVVTRGTATGTILDDDDAPTVSAANVAIDEGTGTTTAGTVTVALSAASGRTVTVDYATVEGTATAADFAPIATATLTFAPGETSKTVNVSVVGDDIDEHDETFTVALSGPVNAVVGAGGTVTITDDDDPPVLTIADVEAVEPVDPGAEEEMVFAIVLTPESGKDVHFDVATAGGTATSGTDFIATGGPLTIPAGGRGTSVTVTILGDSPPPEGDETLTLVLSEVVNATGPAAAATGTILDSDIPATLRISGGTVVEGTGTTDGVASLTVSLIPESTSEVGVTVNTADGSATAGDYAALTDETLTFAPGETVKTVDIAITADDDDEPDETFTVALTDPTGGAVLAGGGADTATVTILDDDGPTITVTGPSPVTEGNEGTADAVFTVDLSGPSAQEVRVDFATAAGTATSPDDFTAQSGTLTFPPDTDDPQTVVVKIVGETAAELDEQFSLSLSNAVNATLANSTATAVITDDDRPVLTIADATVVEGNSGAATANFVLTLAPAADQGVTVDYTTADGTAAAAEDFLATAGKVFFAAGETTRTISVPVLGDTAVEPDETFTIELSNVNEAVVALGDGTATGTIVDDDGPPAVSTAGVAGGPDPVVTEGTGSTVEATVEVRLSAARAFPVTVDYATASGSAAAVADFVPASGTLTFEPGETAKTVTVLVEGDSRHETAEAFRVVASAPTNATLTDGDAFVTILDDDGPGYILAASDGGIFNYGAADFYGSTGAIRLNQPIVGVAGHPSGRGYWLVAADGGIFAFGEADFFGSTGGTALNQPIVGMASTPSGNGYWLVASDGGIFAFGDAGFFGSTGAIRLNQPIVGMASSPSGNGYWLVASDGGIFAFGDAAFEGSTGAIALNRPVVGMAATASGQGYWLVATDGGIFAFGDAAFEGSTGAIALNRPVVGMTATPGGGGYWLVADDGGIFAFGDADFLGSTGAITLNRPVVGMSDL